jgi:hypothetical protein
MAPPSSSGSHPPASSTIPPAFNFTAQVPSSSATIPQMPFGSFPMVLPPFGKFVERKRKYIYIININ